MTYFVFASKDPFVRNTHKYSTDEYCLIADESYYYIYSKCKDAKYGDVVRFFASRLGCTFYTEEKT